MFFFKKRKDAEGIALLKAGKLDQALVHFRTRFEKDSKDLESLLELAKIHFKKGEPFKAKDCLSLLVQQDLSEDLAIQVTEITNFKKISSENYFNSFPSFSPDGKWILFTSARQSKSGKRKISIEDSPGVYSVNLRSGSETEVVPGDFYNWQPAFSPQADRVAYLSSREDTNNDGKIDHRDIPALYIKDMTNGKEEMLVPAAHRPKFPLFSPDGQSLLFCAWYSGSPICGIYLMNLKTKEVRTIQNRFDCNFPIFARDGQSILYASWRRDTNADGLINITDNSALMEYDIATGEEKYLVTDKYSNSYPNLSPDGRSIVYLSHRRDTNRDGIINSLDNSGIYLLNLDNKKEKLIVNDKYFNKFPSYTFDGDRVIFLGTWRFKKKTRMDEISSSDYFDHKGIHSVRLNGKYEREIVSSKNYGCRFLATSPKSNWVTYLSWRQETNRGVYAAPIDRLPTKEELKSYIVNNL